MKLKLKVNGNPIEVDLDSFTMGDLMDNEGSIKVLTDPQSWKNLGHVELHERMFMTSEVVARVIAQRVKDQYPDLKWELVQRELPYNRLSRIFRDLISPPDEGNGASPSADRTGAMQ